MMFRLPDPVAPEDIERAREALRRSRVTAAIETLLKEDIHRDCRAYLRRLYLEMTDTMESDNG